MPGYFLRNVPRQVLKGSGEMVAATIRTILALPAPAAVREQRRDRRDARPPVPSVEAILYDAADDVAAFAAFPHAHWKKIWSTNPLERLNKEIKALLRRRRRLPQIHFRVLQPNTSRVCQAM